MSPKGWMICGAVIGALGVVIGAFGAHWLPGVLRKSIDAAEVARRMDIYETGVRYQMYHAPMLVIIGFLLTRGQCWALQTSGFCFLLGILIFSGLLYALVLSGVKILGMIVPIGGLSLIVGWVFLAVAAAMSSRFDFPE